MELRGDAARRSSIGAMIVIACVVGSTAAAFAYTGGWLSPDSITPNKVVDEFAPPGGPALGHRRNHTKGICFTGTFDASGAGATVSTASMFRTGSYPVIGRFNLASPDLQAADPAVRVRGLGLQISGPGNQTWRMALIDPPFFPVATPQAFFAMLAASGSKDSNAMAKFALAHPEFATFGKWAKTAPWTGSFAEEPYNSLDSFVFTNASGDRSVVRWSFRPAATPVPLAADALKGRSPNFLQKEITDRVAAGPVRWNMEVVVAVRGDPTSDPSRAWPANRRTVAVGTLVVDRIQPEPDGPCRDLNFDPTVLPAGMGVSDDPFPAARSSAYRRSYDLRTAEWRSYPYAAKEVAQ